MEPHIDTTPLLIYATAALGILTGAVADWIKVNSNAAEAKRVFKPIRKSIDP